MTFRSGHEKHGGIQTGQKHYKTMIRDRIFEAIIKDLPDRLCAALDDLLLTKANLTNPIDRLKAIQTELKLYSELLPYFMPKLSAVQVAIDESSSGELSQARIDELKKLIRETNAMP